MRYFITGITGFIGSHLYKRLLENGDTVIAQVRNPNRADALESEGVEVLRGDMALFRDENLVLPQVDYVIHLAGVVAAPTVADYEAINYQAVVDLVQSLHRQSWRPKRFLFASSLAAAGPNPDSRSLTEESECRPVDPYGVAKLRAEKYLNANADFPTSSFRPSLVLGPGDSATLTLYKMVASGVGFKAAGFDQRLSLVDVDDVVDAILAMSAEISDAHQTYFIANDPPVTTTELYGKIAKAVGRRRVITLSIPISILWLASRVMILLASILKFTNQLDDKQYRLIVSPAFVCSAQRLRAQIGWKPNIALDASLKKAVEGYRKLGQL